MYQLKRGINVITVRYHVQNEKWITMFSVCWRVRVAICRWYSGLWM